MKKKTGLIIAILCMAIGFAAVSTTLYINGTATIKSNDKDFKENVIFTEATATNGDASIINNGKAITFTTEAFSVIGDTGKVDFTIANRSDYDAKFETPAIKCTSTDTSYTEYLNVVAGTKLNGKTIARNGTKDSSLTVTLKKSYTVNEKNITYTCTIDVTGVEAN